jgi:hypothetical protein
MISNQNNLCKLLQNVQRLLFASIILALCLSSLGRAQTMLNAEAPPITSLQVAGIKFMIVNGQLLARAATKQGKDWRFGQDIQAIAATKDQIFTLSGQGKLTALRVTDGKQHWSVVTGLFPSPSDNGFPIALQLRMKLTIQSGILLASTPTGEDLVRRVLPILAAFDTTTGKRLWNYSTVYNKDDPCQSIGAAAIYADIIIWDFWCSGAYSYTYFRAFKVRSGKLLWKQFSRISTDYGAPGGGFIFIISDPFGTWEMSVEKIEIRTGKRTTRIFSVFLRPNCGLIEPVNWTRRFERKSILFSGKDRCGSFQQRFPLW